MKNTIIFTINNEEYITIALPQPLKNLFRYDEVTITYHNNAGQEYVLLKSDFIIEVLRILQCRLTEISEGTLKLDTSIKKDIGYLWNKKIGRRNREYIANERIKFAYIISSEGTRYWIGEHYRLWESKNRSSWIYEKDDKIYFEATAHYPWYCTPTKEAKKDPLYVTFQEFMKHYKPLIITTIDRDTLIEWQKKVDELLPLIEANDSKYFCNENCSHETGEHK